MKSKFLFFLIIISSKSIYPQFSKDSTKLRLTFDSEVNQMYYHRTIEKDVYLNHGVSKVRYNGISDNPLLHSAVYGTISTKSVFGKESNFKLYFNTTIEHRGWSYGIYDMNNIVFYPNLFFLYSDTIKLGNKNLILNAKIGDFNNDSISNNMYFYNIDWQGIRIRLDFSQYYIQYNHISDLSRCIGLNISELYFLRLGYLSKLNYTDLDISTDAYIANNLIPVPGNFKFINSPNIDFNFALNKKRKINFLLTFSLPEINKLRSSKNYNIAGTVKYSLNRNNFKSTYSISGKYFHSTNFLRNHFYSKINYTDNSDTTYPNLIYGNSVGRILYPLKNYWYPVSQWMVYNEIANSTYDAEGIIGIELYGKLDAKIYKNLYNSTVLELFYFYCKDYFQNKYGVRFYYTNYTYYKFNDNLKLGILFTDKIMNLNNAYQTFYQSVFPFIGFSIQKQFDADWY